MVLTPEQSKWVQEKIAEVVMGWVRLTGDQVPADHWHQGADGPQEVWVDANGQRMACRWCGDMPGWTEYTKEAWELVCMLADRHFAVKIEANNLGRRLVSVWSTEKHAAGGYILHGAAGEDRHPEDMPEALCLAVLKAHGVNPGEMPA